ncbi:hypothetical protein J4464_04910 [Candidatus Woesearchaeota archaeon]|nr:hypothetical protein [Candidatus Woesearchaeota archaeon]
MSKKADLNLSIQAIVIIILAITLLGLGLTFMRQFIGRGSESLSGILEGVQLENPATSNTPITVKRDITVQTGKTEELLVGFYCSSSAECINAKPGITQCVDKTNTLVTNPNPATILIAPQVKVGSHESIGYKAILTPPGVATLSPFICTIQVDSWSSNVPGQSDWKQSKQVIIEVI